MRFTFEIGRAGSRDSCMGTKKKMPEGVLKLGSALVSNDENMKPSMMWRQIEYAEKAQLAQLKASDGWGAIQGWGDLSMEEQEQTIEIFDGILAGKKKAKTSAKRKSTGSSPKEPKEKKAKAVKAKDKDSQEKTTKKKAASGGPKRAKSAYMYFTLTERNNIVKANPEAKQPDIMKLMGEEWKKMSDEDKVKYNEMAATDKARYEEQKKQFDETGSYTKTQEEEEQGKNKTDKEEAAKKAKKCAENGPKKGKSAYMLFTLTERETVVKANPEAKATEIMKLMGEQWKKMSDEDKQKYNDMAAADKARFEEQKKQFEETGSFTKTKEEEEKEKNKADKEATRKAKKSPGGRLKKDKKKPEVAAETEEADESDSSSSSSEESEDEDEAAAGKMDDKDDEQAAETEEEEEAEDKPNEE